mgnify:CR=1 FL=1
MIAAAVAGAFLLAGLQLFHSVLDSLLIFGALITGKAPFGYLDWLGWFSYTAVGNLVGGLAFVGLVIYATHGKTGPLRPRPNELVSVDAVGSLDEVFARALQALGS